MKNSLLAALDLALTVIFIGGGVALLLAGVWQGIFAHNVMTGIVLAVIGALLAGTPLSRMGSVGPMSRSEGRLQMLYWRTGVTPPKNATPGPQTPLDDD